MSTIRTILLSNQYQKQDREPGMSAADEQHADEQSLVEQARRGSHEAFRFLVERHMKQAYNIAWGMLGHHELAEDVVQEAFVRAYRGLPSFRGDAAFATWIQRIVMNLSLNKKKGRQRRKEHVLSHVDVEEISDHNHDNGSLELRDHLEKALHELPTLQRAVVLLRHFEGLSTRQVSTILRCSEGTVKTHLFRGLKKMRERLKYFRTELA